MKINFKEAFTNSVNNVPYNVPVSVKNSAINICEQFNIYGICDPMYISNTIALMMGIGDGCSNFNNSNPDTSKIPEIAKRIQKCYGCNITGDGISYIIEVLNNEFNV